MRSSLTLVSILLASMFEGDFRPTSAPATQRKPTAQRVSVIQLLATPERFHGKRVRVAGWWTWRFEVSVLSPNREDADYSMNGIWVGVDEKQAEKFAAAQNGYCVIEGVFDAARGDPRGVVATAIRGVTSVERLIPASERVEKPTPKASPIE